MLTAIELELQSEVVAAFRSVILDMSADERLELIDAMLDGYCRYCGEKKISNEPISSELRCYCTRND